MSNWLQNRVDRQGMLMKRALEILDAAERKHVRVIPPHWNQDAVGIVIDLYTAIDAARALLRQKQDGKGLEAAHRMRKDAAKES